MICILYLFYIYIILYQFLSTVLFPVYHVHLYFELNAIVKYKIRSDFNHQRHIFVIGQMFTSSNYCTMYYFTCLPVITRRVMIES